MSGRVTPLNATGRLRIFYNSDLTHVLDLLCNVATSPSAAILDTFGTHVSGATASTEVLNAITAIFSTATTFTNWVLQQNVSGSYVPIDEGSLGVNGTAGLPTVPASQNTFVFRDATQKLASLRLLGTYEGAALKLGYAALNTANKAIADELLNGGAGHVGSWRTGRNGLPSGMRFINYVSGLNRKSRRRLGLV